MTGFISKATHCRHYLPVCQAALYDSEKCRINPKWLAKVTCGSFPFRAHPTWDKVSPGLLSAGPGPEDFPELREDHWGEVDGIGATDVLPHPSHSPPGQLQAPPNLGGRMRLPHGSRCSTTPDRPPRRSGHPAHLRSPFSGPRSQRRAVAPPRRGPAELPGLRSAPPARAPPAPSRTAPRGAGEVEQGEARGGRAGGDAQGARVGADSVGTHPAAVPTPARDLAETPRGSSPAWILLAFTLH